MIIQIPIYGFVFFFIIWIFVICIIIGCVNNLASIIMRFIFLIVLLNSLASIFSSVGIFFLGVRLGIGASEFCFAPFLISLISFRMFDGYIKYFLVQALIGLVLVLSMLFIDVSFFLLVFFYLPFFCLFVCFRFGLRNTFVWIGEILLFGSF